MRRSKAKLHAIADDALEAFFANVVEQLPECTSGDFGPCADLAIRQACRDAVEVWYGFNCPHPKEGE